VYSQRRRPLAHWPLSGFVDLSTVNLGFIFIFILFTYNFPITPADNFP